MQRHLLSLATAAALLALSGQAHAATTTPDSAITAAGSPVTIDVAANDTGIGTPRSLAVVMPPQHGTAVVVAGKIVYTPAAGYTGTDSLQYRIKGSRNIGIGTVRIDIGNALVLQGRVTDAPIADATVVASVGGHEFTAVADAEGNYSLPVVALGDPMVQVYAQGTGAQAQVVLQSTLGGFEGLSAQAGADGTLSREDNHAVQVTQVSTAQAYLMEVANGGQPIADDGQLAQARESMDLGAMMDMAAVIKLVADGHYPLPAGVDDTLDLISDLPAFHAFMGSVNADDPDALAWAKAETLADSEVTAPATSADFVGEYSLMHELGRAGTVRVGLIQGERVELAPDGTGIYAHTVPNPDPSVTWSVANGVGTIIRNNPVASLSFEVVPEIGPMQIRRLDTVTRLDFVVLTDGEGRDVIGVTRHFDYVYPDHPQLPPGSTTSTASQLALSDGYGNLPYAASEFPSRRALPITGTPYANSSGNAIFDFQAGGAGSRSDGQAFDWELDEEGRILVTYPNGDLARFNRLASDGRKGEGVLAETLTAAGERSAKWELSVVLDGSASFDTGNLAHPWHSGFFISPARLTAGPLDFYTVLTGPGQTGYLQSRSGTQWFQDPLSWSVTAGGKLRTLQYRDNTGYKAFCTVGVDGCVHFRSRQWTPIARDGDRVYVIEELGGDLNGDGIAAPEEIDNQRANFYDLQAPPPL
jgi:hypothetical protein